MLGLTVTLRIRTRNITRACLLLVLQGVMAVARAEMGLLSGHQPLVPLACADVPATHWHWTRWRCGVGDASVRPAMYGRSQLHTVFLQHAPRACVLYRDGDPEGDEDATRIRSGDQ